MNIVVLAPHPDDEAIGCGGTLRLRIDGGDRVVAVFLTSGELGVKDCPRDEACRLREAEATEAAEILGVAQLDFLRLRDLDVAAQINEASARLAAVLLREEPGLIFLPHPQEWHPDHRVSLPLVRKTIASISVRPVLATYEVWTPLAEHDWASDVTTTMSAKLRAVRCYSSQLASFRYDRAVLGLNKYRGELAARCRYAEVFQTVPLT